MPWLRANSRHETHSSRSLGGKVFSRTQPFAMTRRTTPVGVQRDRRCARTVYIQSAGRWNSSRPREFAPPATCDRNAPARFTGARSNVMNIKTYWIKRGNKPIVPKLIAITGGGNTWLKAVLRMRLTIIISSGDFGGSRSRIS